MNMTCIFLRSSECSLLDEGYVSAIGGSSVSQLNQCDTRNPGVAGWPSSYAPARRGEGEARSPLPHSAPKKRDVFEGPNKKQAESPFILTVSRLSDINFEGLYQRPCFVVMAPNATRYVLLPGVRGHA